MHQAESVYLPTYVHAGPYAVGVLFGFFFHWDLFDRPKHGEDNNNDDKLGQEEKKKKEKKSSISPWVSGPLWLASLAAALTILMYTLGWNRGHHWNPISAVVYGSLHRTVWAAVVGWVVWACATGHGGSVNSLLSCKLFIPLSRLSYMGYLMHFLVLWMRYAYLRATLPFSHYTLVSTRTTCSTGHSSYPLFLHPTVLRVPGQPDHVHLRGCPGLPHNRSAHRQPLQTAPWQENVILHHHHHQEKLSSRRSSSAPANTMYTIVIINSLFLLFFLRLLKADS